MTHQWAGQPQNDNLVLGVDGYGSPLDVSSSNPLPVVLEQGVGPQLPAVSNSMVAALSTSFAAGQQAVTGTAAKLNSGTSTSFKNGFLLTNLSTSSASMFIGGSGVTTSAGYEIAAGISISVPIADLSTIYVIASGSSVATASWIGLS